MDSKKNLNYEEFAPESGLVDFVKYFWHSKPMQESVYTILPDGYFDLIVQLEDSRIKSIELFGLYTKEVEIRVPAGAEFWGITFKPLAAEYLLRRSIASLLNTRHALAADYWGINSFSDFSQFIGSVNKHILHLLSRSKKLDDRKLKLFELIYNSTDTLPVQDLADQVFWTARQINRYFKERLGLILKSL
jgi:hypothetical protein